MKYKNINPLEKLHPGEPYFFIRAQDLHSTYAVEQYAECVGILNPQAKQECLKIAEEMRKWQERNTDKVKLPD